MKRVGRVTTLWYQYRLLGRVAVVAARAHGYCELGLTRLSATLPWWAGGGPPISVPRISSPLTTNSPWKGAKAPLTCLNVNTSPATAPSIDPQALAPADLPSASIDPVTLAPCCFSFNSINPPAVFCHV